MSDQDILPAVIIEGEVEQFMPVFSLEDAKARMDKLKAFVSDIMIKDKDFGIIQGTKKDTLLKPGAEKLTKFFGLRPTFVDERSVENWEADEPFFFYLRKCQLWRGDVLIAEASGSCNSKESRYRWRWVQEDDIPENYNRPDLKTRGGKKGMFQWQIDNRQTTGQYGKPESYWLMIDQLREDGKTETYDKEQHWDNQMKPFIEWDEIEYRVPNEDIFSQVNTILKMAEKRALVAATLIGCNASEFFTQDMEDIGHAVSNSVVDVVAKDVTPKTDAVPEIKTDDDYFQYAWATLKLSKSEAETVQNILNQAATPQEAAKGLLKQFPVSN